MTVEERDYPTIEAAAGALAQELARVLGAAVAARGRANLAVSGGRTPRHVFERLRREAVDWSRVTVTLTDERWIPADHPDSNEGLVRAHLLHGPAAAATFVPLYGGEDSPEAGQPACEARLAALAGPLDAVYLGLGGDGHIASLFPGDPALEVRDRLCAAVPGTAARRPRMTLTPLTLLKARQVFLLFSGADKHAAYAEAGRPGPYAQCPLRLMLAQDRVPVTVLKAP